MTLTRYKQKRKFSGTEKTTEPKPTAAPSTTHRGIKNKKQIFVIHKHHASHLHWDFRLEMNGVLKSWAVPKEPPKAKGIKRLAVQVEDHPLEYAKFHGTIPEGHYGAGKVEIWDSGTYELIEKDSKKIEFKLNGKKLKGNFVLVKTHYGNKPEKSWLLFKV
jgi:DNA ligase D-like protein (predicted 3'-phosphoesterase)